MELIMLCGIPTSGKSTYVDSLLKTEYARNCVVLSTDYFIEFYANKVGKTYNEVFDEYIKSATEQMESLLRFALKNEKNIIWDQTNLTAKTRRNKLNKVPDSYTKRAVYFEISLEDALTRNDNRKGKFISKSIIKRMYHQYERPTYEENFQLIEEGQ